MHKVIFLDRDGTINVDKGYVHRPQDWEWLPKAPEALTMLQDAGYLLAIVTNQSGIGHGLYTEEAMHQLHDYMMSELKKKGITLATIEYCIHRRDGTCECRKPGTKMATQVEAKVGSIQYADSWTIGDKIADMQFGKNIGTKTILLRSNYWTEADLADTPDAIADSLYEAAQFLIRGTITDQP